jgi:hypothetical protein
MVFPSSGVTVRAPFVTVLVRSPAATALDPRPPLNAMPPAEEPVSRPGIGGPPPVPAGEEATPLPAPTPIMQRGMTLAEFAAAFQPVPGNHEVVLLHPKTCCPVKVCFTLPCGCPKKVSASQREVVFDYGREKVKIRFPILSNGVRVSYR